MGGSPQKVDPHPALWHPERMLQPPDDLSDDQIEIYQQALEYFHAGSRYRANGEIADALVAFRNSIALYPAAVTHTLLAELYALVQRNLDAIEECRNAIACDPTYGDAWVRMGICWLQLDEDEQAIEALQQACALDGYAGRLRALFALAGVLEKHLRWQEAYDLYAECHAQAPGMREAQLSMNRVLGRLN